MVTVRDAQWTFSSWNNFTGADACDLHGAAVVISVAEVGAGINAVDGARLFDVWGSELGASYAGPIYLPTIYDPQRRIIPYRHRLRLSMADRFDGCIQCLNIDPAMYSPSHHLELRFLTLRDLGSTTPATLTVEGAAVLLRISNYNPGAASIDGLPIFNTLRTGPIFDVRQDWPPVYDQQFRVIPYRQTFRFAAQGGQPIEGGFTCVDIVAN